MYGDKLLLPMTLHTANIVLYMLSLPLTQYCDSSWSSSNAILLFIPIAGESVIYCLVRREELLCGGTFDDDILLILVSDLKILRV